MNVLQKILASIIAVIIERFLTNLAKEHGAPRGASHLSGPEIDRAIQATIKEYTGS